MKYSLGLAVLTGLLATQPVFAQENEIVWIRTSNSLGADFNMLVYSMGLGRVGPAAAGDDKKSNVRLKLAVSRSSYDSNYDFVPGRGSDNSERFLLDYRMPLSEGTTMTLTGGVTRHRTKVRPITVSSPTDTSEWGPFMSVDIYAYLDDRGSVYGLAEYDRAGSVFAMASYVRTFGGFNIGPSISYTSNRDYKHATLGLTGSYKLDKNIELTVSAGKIRSRSNFNLRGNGNYLDTILKFQF